MKDKQEIIIRYITNGESIRKISREMQINRQTVRRYINQYSKIQQELLSADKASVGEYIEDLVKAPKYDSSTRIRRKATDELVTKIKEYLDSNQEKRSLGQRKQQMKKIDIYESLKESGFDIGYTSVCNLINIIENRGQEAFIKQTYNLGDICEFDWGEVKIFINDTLETYQLAVFTSAAGNYRYGHLFKKQDTLSFQQSHALFFDKIGGVYKMMVYDNMRVVIKKFVGVTEKEPTDGLLKLSIYYNFDFRFCNVRRGNEKGHVERSVEYLRRKAFSVKDHFSSLEEANRYLEEMVDKLNTKPQIDNDNKSAIEVLELEKAYLLPKKPLFDCGELRSVRVDKYSTVSLDTCHYSVPEQYVGKIITAKVYPQKVVFCFDDQNICKHTRVFGFHKWSINIEHYSKTLTRKPGALAGSLAMKQLDSRLQKIYKKHYLTNPKDFVELIDFMKKSAITIGEIESAISKLQITHTLDITTDKLKVICEQNNVNPQQNVISVIDSKIKGSCKSQLSQLTLLFNNSENLNNKVEVLI